MGDKIVTIVMSIALTIIILFGILFVMTFGLTGSNKVVDLSDIDEDTKEEIIKLMNLSDMSNDVELIKAQMPTVYRDIYYEVYFYSDNNVSKAGENSDGYGRDLYNVKDNEYSCTIYKLDDSSIDLLENLFEEKAN